MKRKMRRLLAMLLAFTLTFSVASTDVLAAGLEAAQEEGVITTQAPEAETLSEESTEVPDEEAEEAQSEETTEAPDEEAEETQSEEAGESFGLRSLRASNSISISDAVFFEGFEGGSIPDDWRLETDTEGYNWAINQNNRHGGDKSVHVPYVSKSDGEAAWLISPAFDFSEISGVPQIVFWYWNKRAGSSFEELRVYYRADGGDWKELFRTEAGQAEWSKQIVSFPEDAKKTNVEIGFEGINHDGNGLYLDDVYVLDSTRSCEVSYRNRGGEMEDVVFTYSFMEQVAVKENMLTVPSKKYFTSWNTKEDGSGTTFLPGEVFDVSESVTLYAQWNDQFHCIGESFEGDAIPEGWTWKSDTEGYGWSISTAKSHYGDAAAYVKYLSGNGQTTWLISPACDFSDLTGELVLSFWYMNKPDYGKVEELGVFYRVSNGEWQELFKTQEGHDDWTQQVINVPAEAKTENVEIGFQVVNHDGYGVRLDDVYLDLAQALQPVTITYQSNGGTGVMEDPNSPYEIGTSVKLLPNGFHPPAKKRFVSWNTKEDGSGMKYNAGEIIFAKEDLTLFAQWADQITSLLEDFEGDGIPEGWMNVRETKSYYWKVTDYSHSGSKAVGDSYVNSEEENTAWLIMPAFNFGDYVGVPKLMFWLQISSWSNQNDAFYVCYRVNGGEWKELSKTETEVNTWTKQILYLPEETKTAGVEIGFKVVNRSSEHMYLDDVCVMDSNRTHEVTYHANGGTGSMQDPKNLYHAGDDVTILDNGFTTPPKKRFISWNDKADGSGKTYMPGDSVEIMEDLLLYAQWADQFTGLSEGFEEKKLPEGWRLESNDTEYHWSFVWGGSSGANEAYVRQVVDGDGKTAWLITPACDLSDRTGAITLSFWLKTSCLFDVDRFDELSVWYRIRGGAWQELYKTKTAQEVWSKKIILLPEELRTEHVEFGFRCFNRNGYGLSLDDVLLQEEEQLSALKVTYDANGGSGVMETDGTLYDDGAQLTVPLNAFAAPAGKKFDSWNTKADGSGIAYKTGKTLTIHENVTLYAQWIDRLGILDEGFEDAGIPAGWMVSADDEGNAWSVGQDKNYAITTHSGNHMALMQTSNAKKDGKSWLISPKLDLSGAGKNCLLQFWHKNPGYLDASYSLSVCYRVNGGSWREVFSTNAANEEWKLQSIILPDGARTKNVEIGFMTAEAYSYGVYLDDVLLRMTERDLYSITLPKSTVGGNVSSDLQIAEAGDLVTLTLKSKGIYKLKTITVKKDSVNVATTQTDESTCTFVMPSGNVTVDVTFQLPAGVAFCEDFDDSYQLRDWTFVDSDGDGQGWYVIEEWEDDSNGNPLDHSASNVLTSLSRDPFEGPVYQDNWAITPAITIPENAKLTFWIRERALYTQCEKLAVYVGNTTDVNRMTKVGGDYSANLSYEKIEVNLGSYAGQTIHVAFRHYYDDLYSYMLNLDDVMVVGSGADVLRSITYDANDGTGETIDPRNPYYDGRSVTILQCKFNAPDGTEFYGWNTSPGGSGTWYFPDETIEISSDVTLYAQWAETSEVIKLFEEGFESGDIPEGWSTENPAEGYPWTVFEGDYKPSMGARSGKKYALMKYGRTGDVAWLITPVMNLSDFHGMTRLSFWYVNGNWLGYYYDIDELSVWYRVNGGEWHKLFHTDVPHSDWTHQFVYLPSEARVANVELGFMALDGGGMGIGLDDVSLTGVMEQHEFCALNYDANGGSGETKDAESPHGAKTMVTVLKNSFTPPEGKMFVAWNTMANGSGETYRAGDVFKIRKDVTLYAQWEDLPVTVSEIEEGFEGGSLPSGWKLEGNHETYAWTVGTGDEETSPGAHSGEKNALITHVERNATAWIVSPWLDLSDGPNYVLRFWFVNRRNLIRTDSLKVCYRVLGGDWVELYQVNRNNSSWTMEEILLPEEARKAYVEIGFCATDDNGMGIGLDDVELKVSTDAFYHVDVEPASNGTVKADADDKRVGEVVTISATPAGGYKLAELNVTCGEQTVALTRRSDGLYEFVMPAGDVNVKARFLPESAVVSYELWVGGTQVTSANAADVLGNGAASYDGITKILTLSKNVANENGDGISSNVNGLILKTTAPLMIRSGEEDALELLGPATIETNGLLTLAGLAENYGCGISAEAPVTIRNSEIAASGWWGIFGATSDAWTTIRNSSVTAEGTRSAASKIKLDGSYVASPMDVEFRENGFVYLPDGYMARNLVIVPSLKDENLAVSKKSLTLYDTITIDFKVAKSAIEGKYHDPYLMVTQNGKEKKITEWEPSDDGTLMIFSYRVAPHNMRDVVTAVPHALNADGADVMGPSMEYSVADYCYNMLSMEKYQTNEWAPFRRLLVDILRYGDAAQTYAGYKTAEPASWKLTRAQRAMGTDVTAAMNYTSVRKKNCATVENPLASIETAALFLEAAVNIQFKYEASDLAGLRVVVTDDEEGANVLGEYPADASLNDNNGRYYVTFNYLNAGQMRKTVYATVMKGSEKVSNTFRYSIESYAYSMTGREGYESLSLLLDAMMRYGDSAADFAAQ